MLRALVVALVAANLLLFGWTLGWVDLSSEREPDRANRQYQPQAVELLAPSAASAAMAQPAAVPAAVTASAAVATSVADASPQPPGTATPAVPAERPVCLEAGPFAQAEVAAAERGLREQQLASLAWIPVKSERGGTFIVYQGKFADEAALARRRDELRKAQIPFDELRGSPDLQPGLSFGRYDSRPTAEQSLEELRQRGVRNARVVTITPAVTVTLLRVERADAQQAARLQQLNLPPTGAPFRPCAGTP